MSVPHYQNAGQTREMKIANRSFEDLSQFKYSGRRVTHQNLMQKEIKRRVTSGHACSHKDYNFACEYLWV
jgi:hypothetical protein